MVAARQTLHLPVCRLSPMCVITASVNPLLALHTAETHKNQGTFIQIMGTLSWPNNSIFIRITHLGQPIMANRVFNHSATPVSRTKVKVLQM